MWRESQTVLVTGGTGFIGSSVVRRAAAKGNRVVSLVRKETGTVDPDGVERLVANWSDPAQLTAIIARVSPRAIVHCAGVSGRHCEDASTLYAANVGLVWTLLAATAQSCPGASTVLLSSAAVYGPQPTLPTAEDAPPAPVGHYATSKAVAERIAEAFGLGEGLRVCMARPFNVVGPGEPSSSIVSTIVDQLTGKHAGGKALIRLREIASVRDFVDVDDVAEALLLLCNEGTPGEAYNICSGRGIRIADLVESVCRVSGCKVDLHVADPLALGTVSIGSCDKLRHLGWNPAFTLDESLERVLREAPEHAGFVREHD